MFLESMLYLPASYVLKQICVAFMVLLKASNSGHFYLDKINFKSLSKLHFESQKSF